MKKTRRVAVAINLTWPFRHHVDVFSGIQRYARDRKWHYFVDPFFEGDLNGKSALRLDGIVGRATVGLAAAAAAAGIPAVNVWSGSPDRTLPRVVPNYEGAGRSVADYLLKRGYRRFGFLGYSHDLSSDLMHEGFRAALRAEGCGCLTHRIGNGFDEEYRAWQRFSLGLRKWVNMLQPPVAVFATMDLPCRHLAEACLQAGLRIPEDVALVGGSNNLVICDHPEPSLSSMDFAWERVGYEAAELLDRLMAGDRPSADAVLVEPNGIVARRSTDSYVVTNPLVGAALRFISERGHLPIRVNDIAKHVHTTSRSLERHFHKGLGLSVAKEIARMRLERLKRLLVDTDEMVKKLAAKCGFTDAVHLCRVFQRAEGVSPGEYRRRHRPENRPDKAAAAATDGDHRAPPAMRSTDKRSTDKRPTDKRPNDKRSTDRKKSLRKAPPRKPTAVKKSSPKKPPAAKHARPPGNP